MRHNGASVLAALEAKGGSGLPDRLIADDYHRGDLCTLTLDERMAKLPAALLLRWIPR